MTICGACGGSGKVHCSACGGTGRKTRMSRYGVGGLDITSCAVCYGRGRKRCDFCHGTGKIAGAQVGGQPNTVDVGSVLKFLPSSGLKCPLCDAPAIPGGFKIWQIIVAILFFPLGILALFAPRKPNQCTRCYHTWT